MFNAVKENCTEGGRSTVNKSRTKRNCNVTKSRTVSMKVPKNELPETPLVDLFGNQKPRSDRLIVSEENKSAFWKNVQKRLRENSTELGESLHRNKRFVKDQLVSANELQKKLRSELISKVLMQSSVSVHK